MVAYGSIPLPLKIFLQNILSIMVSINTSIYWWMLPSQCWWPYDRYRSRSLDWFLYWDGGGDILSNIVHFFGGGQAPLSPVGDLELKVVNKKYTWKTILKLIKQLVRKSITKKITSTCIGASIKRKKRERDFCGEFSCTLDNFIAFRLPRKNISVTGGLWKGILIHLTMKGLHDILS